MSLVTFFAISLGLIHDEARFAFKVLSFKLKASDRKI